MPMYRVVYDQGDGRKRRVRVRAKNEREAREAIEQPNRPDIHRNVTDVEEARR